VHNFRHSNIGRLLFFIAIGIFIFLLSNRVDELRVYQGATLAMYVVAISSLILLTGYSGQVSLGHGALLAIGGYSAALAHNYFSLPIWLCFIVAVLVTAVAGAILGTAAARLSGPYLAGTTLALAVGLPSIANQFGFLGGEQGLLFNVGMPPARLGSTFSPYKWYFWIAALAALIAIWSLQNILRSRYGRTWRAVRDNEVAAELAGIHVGKSKTLAFTVSASLAGLAGALLAMTISTVSPSAFPLALSFSLLTGAVLSGVTTLSGVMIGAVTLVAMPEIADAISTRFATSDNVTTNLPGLLVSALLLLVVLLVPNGPVEQWRSMRSRKSTKARSTTHQ
jgi:branched-chain amino acid transport system permease protein